MTLHELPDLVQGSDDWHDQRRGMVTASEIGSIITGSTLQPANNMHSRSYAALIASERITGWTDPTFVGDDMLRGWEDEPRAIEVYSAHHAPVTITGFMFRDDWGYNIGYSPDGLVRTDGLIEVKSRRPKKHLQTILADEVPAENMAQIQCGLLVSGRAWCDYISFCGGMPMWRKRVEADPKWQAAIVAAVAKFEEAVEQMVTDYHEAVTDLPMTERLLVEEMVI